MFVVAHMEAMMLVKWVSRGGLEGILRRLVGNVELDRDFLKELVEEFVDKHEDELMEAIREYLKNRALVDSLVTVMQDFPNPQEDARASPPK